MEPRPVVPSEAAQLALPLGHRHLTEQLGGVPMAVEEDEALGCWCMFAPCDNDDTWRSWWARLRGPPGTPYHNMILKLSITLSETYIWRSPRIRFETPVFHPNIDRNGNIDCDILDDLYSPAMASFSKMLLAVLSLLADPTPDVACWQADPGMQSCIRLCAEDRPSFDARARAQAAAHAHPSTWSCAVHAHCDPPVCARARFLFWVGGQITRQRCMPEFIDVWAAHVMPSAMAPTMMAGGLLADHVVDECICRHRQMRAAKRSVMMALRQRRQELADAVAQELRSNAHSEWGVAAHGASMWHTAQQTVARTLILAGHRISQLELGFKVSAALSERRRTCAEPGDGATDNGADAAAVERAVADCLTLFEHEGLCRCRRRNVDGDERMAEWIAANAWARPPGRPRRAKGKASPVAGRT